MNPLSAIFGAGVAVRNALYDRDLFKVKKLSRPVISVGNISAGGSGKTPFVIALGKLLAARGIEFDVLSRGYGRRAKGAAIVDPSGSPEEFGDEPVLMARNLPAPVIVGADRYAAGLLAEQKFSSRLHLLDDGFQHRRLRRDFDIVMLPASDLKDTLLPAGRLREPVSALRRADAVVLLGPGSLSANVLWRGQKQMSMDENADTSDSVDESGKWVAFCGIARPAQFFAGLRELGVEIVATVSFPDHHRYAETDAGRLLALKASAGAAGFVTTEKDVINLGRLAERLLPLRVAQAVLSLENPASALSTLFDTLERRCGCRF